ncbi:MAG: hypothetical protein JWO36_7219 [Myxococcales bacterium]|nr:hypothetical protein [Myxococcales bacterium]
MLRGRIRFAFYSEAMSRVDTIPAVSFCGAGEGTRTLDNQLGRLELYQLSYTRRFDLRFSGRQPGRRWWRKVDSNHRSHKTADLQSAPFGRSGIPPKFRLCRYPCSGCWRWDSNPRPPDYKSGALPTELHQQYVASARSRRINGRLRLVKRRLANPSETRGLVDRPHHYICVPIASGAQVGGVAPGGPLAGVAGDGCGTSLPSGIVKIRLAPGP